MWPQRCLRFPRRSFFALSVAFTLSLLLAASLTAPLWATTTLTNSDFGALSNAIAAGGEIRLAFDGTVTLFRPLVPVTNVTLDATGHFVFLDGGSATRQFIVTNDARLTLVNLSLVNGRAYPGQAATNKPGALGAGGAILNVGGHVSLIGCVLSNNVAVGGEGGAAVDSSATGSTLSPSKGGPASGGAVYVAGGTLYATNCVFCNNHSEGSAGGQILNPNLVSALGGDGSGGALYGTNATLQIAQSRFLGNSAKGSDVTRSTAAGTSVGGAIAIAGAFLTVSNCILAANISLGALGGGSDSALGGAIFNDGGRLSGFSTLFTTNAAIGGDGVGGCAAGTCGVLYGSAFGGAVFQTRTGIMEFQNSAFLENSAQGGGAAGYEGLQPARGGDASGGAINAYSDLGSVSLVNCTLTENKATGGEAGAVGIGGTGHGGAIAGVATTLRNVTIARNLVSAGTGALEPPHGASLEGGVTLTNTLLSCDAGQTNVWGVIFDGGHNICSDASARLSSPSSRNNLDPELGTLGYFGGLTPTIPLLVSSPAIDAGDDSACPATDERGVLRPVGLHCDIGAYEFVPTPSLRWQADGTLLVTYIRQPSRRWVVDMSTNLLDWFGPTARHSDTNGVVSLEDANTEHLTRRFYRLRPR